MRLGTVIVFCWMILVAGLRAENLNWFSDANRTNLTSSGAVMGEGFQFVLGVFKNGFVPTSANKAQWAANWQTCQATRYQASTKRFNQIFTVEDNHAPFTVGADAYVWGFSGNATSGEWILFRASAWDWPAPNPLSPFAVEWNVASATPVIGQIHASGSPFLMKSEAVSQVAPPTLSWDQWQEANFAANDPLRVAEADADQDGVKNLLEYVFGMNPKSPGDRVITPVNLVSGHLELTIPRRLDRPAGLVVEVSDDLLTWKSGVLQTQTVSDGLSAWVVRDLTPLDEAHPRRFMRLRVIAP